MTNFKIGVVGGGHLGKIHAKLLSEMDGVEVVGVVDPNPAAREEIEQSLEVATFASHMQLVSRAEAVVVATPTVLHNKIGLELIDRGIHVLIEKPLACTVAESDELIQRAEKRNVVLQVGHVERFNPAFVAARPHISDPLLLQACRTGAYTFRSTDIGVVFDLMIHDIDIILNLVPSSIVKIEAAGCSVFGEHEDIADVRLTFKNGCVATLTTSRVSNQSERSLTVFQHDAEIKVDFGRRSTDVIGRSPQLAATIDAVKSADRSKQLQQVLFTDLLPWSTLEIEERNAIAEEQRDFIACIKTSQRPQVSGDDGRQAIALAAQICSIIHQGRASENDMRGHREAA